MKSKCNFLSTKPQKPLNFLLWVRNNSTYTGIPLVIRFILAKRLVCGDGLQILVTRKPVKGNEKVGNINTLAPVWVLM